MQYRLSRHARTAGFTLIEVMISIAIVLLLVAGINVIFQTASKAVGAGQTLSAGARDNQAAQSVMFSDFSSCVTVDSPYIIIYSKNTPAFRNQADMQGDRDYDASNSIQARQKAILSIDLDNNGTEGEAAVPGEVVSPTTVNHRNHRTDIIEFFARGQFHRQTGNPGTYSADQGASEAQLWYGHLAIPNNFGTVTNDCAPGAGTFGANDNPNNFFATQWALGREATLLSTGDAGSPVKMVDSHNVPQNYIDATAYTGSGVPTDLTPLWNKPDTAGASAKAYTTPAGLDPDASSGSVTIQSSRYDIANTSMAFFKKQLLNWGTTDTWWCDFMSTDFTRFQADPFITRPLTSSQFAKTSPIFLPGCTQFIVEFAGDFVTQDNDVTSPTYGKVTADAKDGAVDYYIDADKHRQIRWYGFPRSTSGKATISATNGDVVPKQAVLAADSVTPAASDFQQTGLTTDEATAEIKNVFDVGAATDYASTTYAPGTESLCYKCAWGPGDTNRPQLIRITYTLDDPSARLPDGLTYEYVFKLP